MEPALFKALVRAHGRAGVKLQRMLHPVGIAADYRDAIVAGPLADAHALVLELIVPALPRLAAGASRIAHDAEDDLGKLVDDVRDRHSEKWTRARFGSIPRPAAEHVADFQKRQLNAALRAAVAVDVIGAEPWLAPAVAEFTAENVALIKTIPSVYFDNLEKSLASQIADGVRWEEMSEGIENTYGVAKSRAELIARDQAGKFYGDLNRVRQVELGITRGVWQTVNDNRVREEHVERDGVSFDWSEGIDGETPGEPVLCRCYADPDLEALLAD